MSILKSRTFVAKMKSLWGSEGYFNLCLKLIFQKDSDVSKGLVVFPNLWARVKITWKQIAGRDFLKVKRCFSISCFSSVLSSMHPSTCASSTPSTTDTTKWHVHSNQSSRNNIHFTLRYFNWKQLRYSTKTQYF